MQYIHCATLTRYHNMMDMLVGFKRHVACNDDTSSELKRIREELVKERITTAHKNKASLKCVNEKILSGVNAIMDRNVAHRWHDVHKKPTNNVNDTHIYKCIMNVAHPIHEKRNRCKQRMEEPIDISIAHWQAQQPHIQMKVAVLCTNINTVEPFTENGPLLYFEDVTGVFMDDTFLCKLKSDSFAGQMCNAGYDLFLCDANDKPVVDTQMFRCSQETHQP